jgi:hypothetical protein
MNNINHINRTKNAVNTLLNVADELRNVDYEYTKSGAVITDDDTGTAYGTNLDENSNPVPNVTAAEYMDAITTIRAVLALLDAGHATNLLKVK